LAVAHLTNASNLTQQAGRFFAKYTAQKSVQLAPQFMRGVLCFKTYGCIFWMDLRTKDLLDQFVEHYQKMLTRFRPCKPGGEYLEQNLITHLCHTFLKFNQSASAFTEVPLQASDGKWKLRFDALLLIEDEAYVVEAKKSSSFPNLCRELNSDVKKLKDSKLRYSLDQMAKGPNRDFINPSKVSVLLVADHWAKTKSAYNKLSNLEKNFGG
jgi:hypothetical protein